MSIVGSRNSGQQASIKLNAVQQAALQTKGARAFKAFTTASVNALLLNVNPRVLSSSFIFGPDKLRSSACLNLVSFATFSASFQNESAAAAAAVAKMLSEKCRPIRQRSSESHASLNRMGTDRPASNNLKTVTSSSSACKSACCIWAYQPTTSAPPARRGSGCAIKTPVSAPVAAGLRAFCATLVSTMCTGRGTSNEKRRWKTPPRRSRLG